ncbi:MAG: sigma-70 family RNA polymerase sigma factor [Verrucomicrobia bacterium]|nr:sigma-70 family RNA polymerase sigma factor [Verrucomicrobiota bacterium]
MLSGENIAAVLLSERLALTAFIASVTRDFHLAEDIFQEVCVKAVGRSGEFESAQHVVNWARVAGRNRAVDVLRARNGRYDGLNEEMLATLAQDWPAGDFAADAHDALAYCLEKLNANNRELLRLRYFERCSGAEVAAAMGRKLETVYQALARIHKSLGECVRKRLQLEASS